MAANTQKSLATELVLVEISNLTKHLSTSTAAKLKSAPKRSMKSKPKKIGSEELLEVQLFGEFPKSEKFYQDVVTIVENLSYGDMSLMIEKILDWGPVNSAEYMGMRQNQFETKAVSKFFAQVKQRAIDREPDQWNFILFLEGVVRAYGMSEGISWEILECILDYIVADLTSAILKNYRGEGLELDLLTKLENLAFQQFKPRQSLRMQDGLWNTFRSQIRVKWSEVLKYLSVYHFDENFNKFTAIIGFFLEPVTEEEAASLFQGIRLLQFTDFRSETGLKRLNAYLGHHMTLSDMYPQSNVKVAQVECLMNAFPQFNFTDAQEGTSLAQAAGKMQELYSKVGEWSKNEDIRPMMYRLMAIMLARGSQKFFDKNIENFMKQHVLKNLSREKSKIGCLVAVLLHLRGMYPTEAAEVAGEVIPNIAVMPDSGLWEGNPALTQRKYQDKDVFKYCSRVNEKHPNLLARLQWLQNELFPKKGLPKLLESVPILVDIVAQIGVHSIKVVDAIIGYLVSDSHKKLEYWLIGLAAARIILSGTSGFSECPSLNEADLEKFRSSMSARIQKIILACESVVGINEYGIPNSFMNVVENWSALPALPKEPVILQEKEAKKLLYLSIYREAVRCVPLIATETSLSGGVVARLLIHSDTHLASATSIVLQQVAHVKPELVFTALKGTDMALNGITALTGGGNTTTTIMTHQASLIEVATKTGALPKTTDSNYKAVMDIVYRIEAHAFMALCSYSVDHRKTALKVFRKISALCGESGNEPRLHNILEENGTRIIFRAIQSARMKNFVTARDPAMEPAPAATDIFQIAVSEDPTVVNVWPDCLSEIAKNCSEMGCIQLLAAVRALLTEQMKILPAIPSEMGNLATLWIQYNSLLIGATDGTSEADANLIQAYTDKLWPKTLQVESNAAHEIATAVGGAVGKESVIPVIRSLCKWIINNKKAKRYCLISAIRVLRVITTNSSFVDAMKSAGRSGPFKELLISKERAESYFTDDSKLDDYEHLIDWALLVFNISHAVRAVSMDSHTECVWTWMQRRETIKKLLKYSGHGLVARDQLSKEAELRISIHHSNQEAAAKLSCNINDLQTAVHLAACEIVRAGSFVDPSSIFEQSDLEWFAYTEKLDYRPLRWILAHRLDLLETFIDKSFSGWKPDIPAYYFHAICDQLLSTYSLDFPRGVGMGDVMEYVLHESAMRQLPLEMRPGHSVAIEEALKKNAGSLLLFVLFHLCSPIRDVRFRAFAFLEHLLPHLGEFLPHDVKKFEEVFVNLNRSDHFSTVIKIAEVVSQKSSIGELVIKAGYKTFDVLPTGGQKIIIDLMTPFFKKINLSVSPIDGLEKLAAIKPYDFLESQFLLSTVSFEPNAIDMWKELAKSGHNLSIIIEFLLRQSEKMEAENRAARTIAFALFEQQGMSIVNKLVEEFSRVSMRGTGITEGSPQTHGSKKDKRMSVKYFSSNVDVERRMRRDTLNQALSSRPTFKSLVDKGVILPKNPPPTRPTENPPSFNPIPTSDGVSAAAFSMDRIKLELEDEKRKTGGFLASAEDTPKQPPLPPKPRSNVPHGMKMLSKANTFPLLAPGDDESSPIHLFPMDRRAVVERKHAAVALLSGIVGDTAFKDFDSVAAMVHFCVIHFNVESGRKSANIRLLLMNLIGNLIHEFDEETVDEAQEMIHMIQNPSLLIWWGSDGGGAEEGSTPPHCSISVENFLAILAGVIGIVDEKFSDRVCACSLRMMSSMSVEDYSTRRCNYSLYRALVKGIEKGHSSFLVMGLARAMEKLERGNTSTDAMTDVRMIISTINHLLKCIGGEVIHHPSLLWTATVMVRGAGSNPVLFKDALDLISTMTEIEGLADWINSNSFASTFESLAEKWSPPFTGIGSCLLEKLQDPLPIEVEQRTREVLVRVLRYLPPVMSNTGNSETWDLRTASNILPWIVKTMSNGTLAEKQCVVDVCHSLGEAVHLGGYISPQALLAADCDWNIDDFLQQLCDSISQAHFPQHAKIYSEIWLQQWHFGPKSEQLALLIILKAFLQSPGALSSINAYFSPLITTSVQQLSVSEFRDLAFEIIKYADGTGIKVNDIGSNTSLSIAAEVPVPQTNIANGTQALYDIARIVQ